MFRRLWNAVLRVKPQFNSDLIQNTMLHSDPLCLRRSSHKHLNLYHHSILGPCHANVTKSVSISPFTFSYLHKHRYSTQSPAYNPQNADPSSLSLPPVDPFGSLDPERTSESLGYTWLTHWQLIEEDRQFRRLAFESTRGRQIQRQQQMLELVTLSKRTPEQSSGSDSDSTDVRIVNGRLSVMPRSGNDSAMRTIMENDSRKPVTSPHSVDSQSDDPVDDLTWLASHPYEELLSEENDADASMRNEGNVRTGHYSWPITDTGGLESTDSSSALPGAIQLRLGNEVATVRPLWISIYVDQTTGVAKLFESVIPLQSEIVDRMAMDLTPFCSVSDLEFGMLADLRHGPWLSYFIGLVGDVGIEESDILWPNQILHRDRVLYNVRGADDVARFLANPRREDVEAHAENLRRLAEERGYRRGWIWYLLRSRWGLSTLKELGIHSGGSNDKNNIHGRGCDDKIRDDEL